MIAVISDVHGNLPALSAVLADIEMRGITRIWCLGDTVGYGPFVNECVQLVMQRCELVLAGNHDLAARGDIPEGLFGGSAGNGIRYARLNLSAANRDLLLTLAPSRILDEVELYHASAIDPIWEYVRDYRVATRHLAAQGTTLSFVGHSHIQLVFGLEPATAGATGGQVPADTMIPVDGVKRVINPGSVGQPRDRDPRAAYAVIEPTHITMRRVPYDTRPMRQAVKDAGLPAEIADRLELGW